MKVWKQGKGHKQRGQRKSEEPLPGVENPGSLAFLRLEFIEWLKAKNYADSTRHTRNEHLRWFVQWAADRDIYFPEKLTLPMLERYSLFLSRIGYGKAPLKAKNHRYHLVSVQQLFKWLCKMHYIEANPASELELPRVEHRLPRHVLEPKEVEAVLSQADITQSMGIRDRAIMEVLYSTGIRRTEVTNLFTTDLLKEQGALLIREGKGGKDRYVPIGNRALDWVEKWSEEIRPNYICPLSQDALFLTAYGQPINPDTLTHWFRRYIKKAEINKPGSCHLFRHSMATHMLENGANVRVIQQILGHAKLESTQIYTHVSIRHLKEVHARTHPAETTKKA